MQNVCLSVPNALALYQDDASYHHKIFSNDIQRLSFFPDDLSRISKDSPEAKVVIGSGREKLRFSSLSRRVSKTVRQWKHRCYYDDAFSAMQNRNFSFQM